MKALGLYVHIPFCARICPYCAFVSVAGREELYDRYVAAVCLEIQRVRHLAAGRPLDTVYFGGGTPGLLEPAQLEPILAAAAAGPGLAAAAEITIEVNPGVVEATRFRDFRGLGFNRLSIGVQSFVDESLKTLGRGHAAAEAENAYRVGREAGFDNVSLDLISGIPGMPQDHWCASVDRTLKLAPEHISAYALTFEEGTLLTERQRRGQVQEVSEEEDAWASEWVEECLEGAGYEHYEVSNFALPGWRSRHNWGCWTGAEYLGVGVSAHSFMDGCRSWNSPDLLDYLQTVETGGWPRVGGEEIDANTAHRERVWMGLRTREGVALEAREGLALVREDRFQALREAGYAELVGANLRLTRKGFLLADALGVELMDLLEHVPGDGGPDTGGNGLPHSVERQLEPLTTSQGKR